MKLEDYDEVINPATGTKIDMKQLVKDQRLAFNAVCSNYPFFEPILSELKWVYTFGVDTQAVDGIRYLVNPEFTAGLSLKEKCFVMMHEATHIALDHITRALDILGSCTREANLAADYEDNSELVENDVISVSWLRSHGACYDEKYIGWSFERILADHPKDPGSSPKDQSSTSPNQQQSQGQGQGQDQQQSQGQGQGQDQKRSPEYVDGWNQALEDYKNGKIKL